MNNNLYIKNIFKKVIMMIKMIKMTMMTKQLMMILTKKSYQIKCVGHVIDDQSKVC